MTQLGPGAVGSITNSGTVSAIGPGGLGAFISGPVTLTNASTGTISSALASGIIANGAGTFNNAGAITASSVGIFSANGPTILSHKGSITSQSASALFTLGPSTITNSGSLSGTTFGAQLTGGTSIVTNAGTIEGTAGPGILFDNFDSSLTNSGNIAGTGNPGVQFGNANNSLTMTAGPIIGSGAAADGTASAVVFGNGNSTITLTGGRIAGSIMIGTGQNTFLWDSGGTVAGAVVFSGGSSTATLRNLTDATLSGLTFLDGGTGTSQLVFDNTAASVPKRFIDWDQINLTNSSSLTFASTLTLGNASNGTGTLSIDPTSTLFAGTGANFIVPLTASELATVFNAGTINLTNGPSKATNSLTIVGNYTGVNGRLLVNTVLGNDSSPSDKLIVSGGAATGSTTINVANVGGLGALTTGNGIRSCRQSTAPHRMQARSRLATRWLRDHSSTSCFGGVRSLEASTAGSCAIPWFRSPLPRHLPPRRRLHQLR